MDGPKKNGASIAEFFKRLTSNWLSGASGGLSVPFTALAAYVSDLPAKFLFSTLAVLSFSIACFSVWKTERERLNEVEVERDSIAVQLKREQERRPTPELFIERSPTHSPYQTPFIQIVNRGVVAVNISFSTLEVKEVSVHFHAIPIIHPDESRNVLMTIKRGGQTSPLTKQSIDNAIKILLDSAREPGVILPLLIKYFDTSGREYITEYELQFPVFNESPTFKYVGRRLVDNSAPKSETPTKPQD
jgi:hypothetical protein